LKKILEDHCLETGKKGLLLLSMPTGSGKTHAVLDFIYDHYREFAERKSKIFFVTNLKKNLPDDALGERFRRNGESAEFGRHVLRIPPTADHVVRTLPRLESEGRIPEEFRTKAFSRLLKAVRQLDEVRNDLRSPGRIHLKQYIAGLESEIRGDQEPSFREEIRKHLKKSFPGGKDERLEAIRENPLYSWIGELYPAVFTDERTVLFLSMDKFFLKNTPVIEPSYYFSRRIPKDSLIFIDEFDASKDRVLKNIIESGWSRRINLIDLFLTVRNALAGNEFPEVLLRESEYRRRLLEEKGRAWPGISGIADAFREKSETLFRRYRLQYAVKSGEGLSDRRRNFLFHDYRFHYLFKDGLKNMKLRADEEERTNWLFREHPSGSGRNDAEPDVRFLLGGLNGFLSYIQKGTDIIAENYCHLKKESGEPGEFSRESAVRTVLSHLQTGKEEREFLTGKIMEKAPPAKPADAGPGGGGDGFYDNGFRCYDIVDSEDHDTCSKVYMYDFGRTPEAFLAELCENAMVVGSSATAVIPSTLANYDLLYLESRLGDSFRRLSGEELARLREAYAESTKGYEALTISPGFIKAAGRSDTLALLTSLYEDEEAAKHWIERFESEAPRKKKETEEDTPEYIAARYARALAAWKRFYGCPSCSAFLCLFSKLCKEGEPEFDLRLLREAAGMLAGIPLEEASKMIVLLGGGDFEEEKAEILRDLKAGERRFVLSSYNTVGAGQNLQYEPPEGAVLVHAGNGERLSEADWSGIYLDKPTSLLVNIYGEDGLPGEELVKYIFQLEFLLQSGALSDKAFRTKLREAFALHAGERRRWHQETISLYDTAAYAQYTTSLLVQAIGRICRTGLKSPEILVLADEQLKKTLAGCRLPEDMLPVKEFLALKQAAGVPEMPDSSLTGHENRESHRSNVVAHRIFSFLNRAKLEGRWTAEDAGEWREMREHLLRHPRYGGAEECPPRWSGLYARLPAPASSYRYDEEHDYADLVVSFEPGRGSMEVSAEAARLPEIAAVPLLRRCFEENGWPVCFPESELLLLPPVFNNIYKGALGEACGRHIFGEVLNIPLFELEMDEFELFDFRIAPGKYVDFKLWNDRIAVPADRELEKIREKMRRTNAAEVYVVNILASTVERFRPVVTEGIVEVPFLCRNGEISEEAMRFLMSGITR